jgi:hypothetical protein
MSQPWGDDREPSCRPPWLTILRHHGSWDKGFCRTPVESDGLAAAIEHNVTRTTAASGYYSESKGTHPIVARHS